MADLLMKGGTRLPRPHLALFDTRIPNRFPARFLLKRRRDQLVIIGGPTQTPGVPLFAMRLHAHKTRVPFPLAFPPPPPLPSSSFRLPT